jgi:hypothetical protein
VRRHKDGRLVDVFLSISPIRDSSGRIIGASKIAHDITEQKKAEAATRQTHEWLKEQAVVRGHSFVFKQPQTPEEESACMEAMGNCPVEAIGDDGLLVTKQEIEQVAAWRNQIVGECWWTENLSRSPVLTG